MPPKEQKATAKLAGRSRGSISRAAGTCSCGGDLIWSKVLTPRGRMMRVCEKCGAMIPKGA